MPRSAATLTLTVAATLDQISERASGSGVQDVDDDRRLADRAVRGR